jgi:tetratricopeptide (TPR) repeat protein
MWITAFVLALVLAGAAHAGPLEDCTQAQDIDRRILGCSDRIRQFPRDATAFFNRGSAFLSKGDLDRAIADNAKVIEIDQGYAAAYYHRGIAYERKQQIDLAIADFSKAVEINPRFGDAFDARARIHLKTDQRSLALRDAERAVAIDSLDERFLDTRARVYEALGRPQDAIADYRRVLTSNPSAKSAIDGLSRLGVSAAAVKSSSDANRKTKRSESAQLDTPPTGRSKEDVECERAQHADPSGAYAKYPCWARAAFGSRARGGR